MSSLSRSNIGAHRGRSAKTHMLMHSHRYTSHISQNLRRSSYCVFLPVSMTLPTHSALHLTINQQTNHTKDHRQLDTYTLLHTHASLSSLSVEALCNISVQYSYLSVIWRCSRKLSSTSSEQKLADQRQNYPINRNDFTSFSIQMSHSQKLHLILA